MNESGQNKQEISTAKRTVERLGGEIRNAKREGDFPKDVADKFSAELKEMQVKIDSLKESPDTAGEIGDIRNEITELEKKVVTRSTIENLNLPTGEKGDQHPTADLIRKHILTKKPWLEEKIKDGGPKTDFYKLALDTSNDAERLAELKVEAKKVIDQNDAIAVEMLRLVYEKIMGGGQNRSVDDLGGYGLIAVKSNDLPRLAGLAEQLKTVSRTNTDPTTGIDRQIGIDIPVSDGFRSELKKLFNKLDLKSPENGQIAQPDEKQFNNEERQLADLAADLTVAYQKSKE